MLGAGNVAWAYTGPGPAPWRDISPVAAHLIEVEEPVATFDPALRQAMIFGGTTSLATKPTLLMSRGTAARPGTRMTIEFASAQIDPSTLGSVVISVIGGGSGSTIEHSGGQDGILLRFWNARAGRWDALASNAASLAAPSPFAYTITNAGDLEDLVSSAFGHVRAEVSTLGVDYGVNRAGLVLDHFEVRFNYRL